MSSSLEESPIINSDIENDVTSSHRNLVEDGPGLYTPETFNLYYSRPMSIILRYYLLMILYVTYICIHNKTIFIQEL